MYRFIHFTLYQFYFSQARLDQGCNSNVLILNSLAQSWRHSQTCILYLYPTDIVVATDKNIANFTDQQCLAAIGRLPMRQSVKRWTVAGWQCTCNVVCHFFIWNFEYISTAEYPYSNFLCDAQLKPNSTEIIATKMPLFLSLSS